MATTDSVIINLLIKEQGVIGAINSQKTLAKQTIELTKLIDNLAARYQIDAAQIVRAIETYNAKVGVAGQGKQINPPAVGGYKLNVDEIVRQKQAQDELNNKQTLELEQNRALVANKRQQIEFEMQLVKLKEQEVLASEKAIQASLKETPADKAFGKQLEVESKATLQAENEQIKKQEVDILANKQQQLRIEIELSKNRVVDIEQARKEAELEDTRLNKAQQRLNIEQRTQQVFVQYNNQLTNIAKMIPADQSTILAKLVPQMAQASGLPINTIMREVQTRFNVLPDTIRKATQEIRQFQNGIAGTAKEMLNLNSIMNTAFGVGMAMLIFQLQMMITKFFTDTIQQAKDLSNAIGKISIAEQVMSKEGIEVSGKDMLKIVSDLKKEFTNVSNVDMLKATGDMALRLAGTGFTPEELKGLLEVANAAKIRNPDRTLEDIMGTVSAAAMSGQVEGVRNLGGGLSVAASDVQAYAKKIGMIKDINDKLTEEQKMHARAGLLIEQNNKTLQETLKLQDNLANAGDKLGASWKNLTEQFAPAIDVWNAILYIFSVLLDDLAQAVKFIGGILDGSIQFSGVFSFLNISVRAYLATWELIYNVAKGVLAIYEKLSGQKLSEQPSISNLANQDTPIGPVVPKADETEENSDKLQKALIDLAEAMDQFADRAKNMEEDFAETMRRLQEDFNIDKNRFLEDWAIDRQKIIDESEDEMARKQRDYDNRKRNAEAKLQEDLRQLREKYLMNLDDALHERDARQVLRLAREYAMNKQNLINEFNISQADSAAQHRAEMEDLAKQRDDRLKALDQERALKLKRMEEDFALKKKREEEEHKQEMERLEQERQDKLRQLAQSLADQLKLNSEGAKLIYDLYLSYFGSKGAIPNIMDASYKTVVIYAERMAKKLQEILKLFKAIQDKTDDWSDAGTGGGDKNTAPNSSNQSPTSSTTLNSGDAFTVPLNQLSALKGGVGSIFFGAQAPKAELLVSLSPDLEARIVNKSLNGMSDIVTKIRRDRK